jgi:hypothetical protein
MNVAALTERNFTEADRRFFAARGIDLSEVNRQIRLLTEEPQRTHAVRACTPGDGVMVVEGQERDRFSARGSQVVTQGRLTDFVPASGAASRMFAALQEGRNRDDWLSQVPHSAAGDKTCQAVFDIFNSLSKFAFYEDLRRRVLDQSAQRVDLNEYDGSQLLASGHGRLVISAMVDENGLGLAAKPKALIPFHRYSEHDNRTALAEHLRTAIEVGAGFDGVCRVHFTCSPEHMNGFQEEAQLVAGQMEKKHGVRIATTFSIQDPSTDTVCVNEQGELARDESGNPILRQAGHGALLFNLQQLAMQGADVVYINNIDNVHPDSRKREFVDSKLMLLGVLADVQESVHRAINALGEGMTEQGLEELYTALNQQLGLSISAEEWAGGDATKKATLLKVALDRPVRVVGVVKNTGEPGGGPIWVRGVGGLIARQLVEKHQLDPGDSSQLNIFEGGTHFNPVRIMCGLRDADGKPYELSRFVDDDAVLISEKSVAGETVRILERPGLWNGSMAGWLTVFVEVDGATFAPVKSVVDLARPAHQC